MKRQTKRSLARLEAREIARITEVNSLKAEVNGSVSSPLELSRLSPSLTASTPTPTSRKLNLEDDKLLDIIDIDIDALDAQVKAIKASLTSPSPTISTPKPTSIKLNYEDLPEDVIGDFSGPVVSSLEMKILMDNDTGIDTLDAEVKAFKALMTSPLPTSSTTTSIKLNCEYFEGDVIGDVRGPISASVSAREMTKMSDIETDLDNLETEVKALMTQPLPTSSKQRKNKKNCSTEKIDSGLGEENASDAVSPEEKPKHFKLRKKRKKKQITGTPKWVTEDFKARFNVEFGLVQEFPTLSIPAQKLLKRGDEMKVAVMEAWPESRRKGMVFEVPWLRAHYKEMEKKMTIFYDNVLANRAQFPMLELRKGMHVVFAERTIHHIQPKVYKRAQIVSNVMTVKAKKGRKHFPSQPYFVKIRLVDHGTCFVVDVKTILFLYPRFSKLPPRAWQFYLEGTGVYKNTLTYRMLMHPKSGIWGDIIRVKKFRSGGVVMFSENIHQTKFPYGINEYIVRRLLTVAPPPSSFKIGDEIRGTLVHTLETGELFIQFLSKYYRHFVKLQNSMGLLQRNPQATVPYLKVGVRVMAPSSDGFYYRAEITRVDIEDDRDLIGVNFIDYGDQMDVPASKVVLAENVHPFFKWFPPMVTTAYLANMENNGPVDFTPLFTFYEDKTKVFFKIVDIAPNGSPIVVANSYRKIKCSRKETPKKMQSSFDGRNLNNLPISVGLAPEKQMGPFTGDTIMPGFNRYIFDVITGDGTGAECRCLRAGRIMKFVIVEYNFGAGLVSMYPYSAARELLKLERRLNQCYQQEWRRFDEIYSRYYAPGESFIARSRRVGVIARIMILKRSTREKCDVDALLVDYGVVESFAWENVRTMTSTELVLPAYGFRAKLSHWGDPVDVKEVGECWRFDTMLIGRINSIQNGNDIPYGEVEVKVAVPKEARSKVLRRLFH